MPDKIEVIDGTVESPPLRVEWFIGIVKSERYYFTTTMSRRREDVEQSLQSFVSYADKKIVSVTLPL